MENKKRIIKFRAWVKSRNEMRDNIHCVLGSAYVYNCMTLQVLPLNNSVLMQFTGLLDKNGKEVYEGDILREVNNALVVEWHNTGFWCEAGDGSWIMPSNFEIIGNIYENPELIKK